MSYPLVDRSPHGLSIESCREKLRELKNLLKHHEAVILDALYQDLRKPSLEAYASEIAVIHHEIDLFISKLKDWRRPKSVGANWLNPAHLTARAEIYPEPKGRVLIIGAWNYPFHLSLLPCIGAFAAGNRFVLKPSELSAQTSKILKKIVSAWLKPEIGLVVEGDATASTELLKERWDHVFFTGGTEIGKKVMQAAAATLSPVTLELGGKSPCLLDETAELETSLKRILWGKFYNAGQTCVAPDYLLVPQALEAQVVSMSREIIRSFYGDDPQKSSDYGRIVNERHFQRLENLKRDGKVCVGGESDPQDRYLSPTLLQEVDLDSNLMRDEIFGPLLPIVPYSNVDEALSVILQREKPLACYIFSQDSERIEKIKHLISAGGICINDTLVHLGNLELPFGGIGHSGMGSYHGYESFRTFTHFKSIERKSLKGDLALRYPPYRMKLTSFLKKWI